MLAKGLFRIKFPSKSYRWPCAANPNRWVTLYDCDILVKYLPNTVNRISGLLLIGIFVPNEDLEEITGI